MVTRIGKTTGNRPANDIGGAKASGAKAAGTTVAGYTFTPVDDATATGGVIGLRVGLRGGALGEVARTLAKLDGVRVSAGPSIAHRGDCFLVHCPGFKLVLSAPAPGEDAAPALLSRTVEPKLALACELTEVFTRLLGKGPSKGPLDPPRASASGPSPSALTRATAPPSPLQEPEERQERAAPAVTRNAAGSSLGWSGTSTLRRSALQAGKTLARKTPLTRKTPLGRGRPPQR